MRRKWPLQARLLTNHNSKQAVLWKYGIQTTQCQSFWPPCRHPKQLQAQRTLNRGGKKQREKKHIVIIKKVAERGRLQSKTCKVDLKQCLSQASNWTGLLFFKKQQQKNGELRDEKDLMLTQQPPVTPWISEKHIGQIACCAVRGCGERMKKWSEGWFRKEGRKEGVEQVVLLLSRKSVQKRSPGVKN